MMPVHARSSRPLAPAGVAALAALAVLCAGRGLAQSPGRGGESTASPFRVVRSISGSRGEIKEGRFIVLDPRTTFRLPEDSTIVVYFEWLGPAGKHRMAGTWRGPANTSTTSTFEYIAKTGSFSAYWEINLPAGAPVGEWTLEATIDGMPAGSHAFEVVGSDAPAPVVTPVREPMTRQEVFARTLETSVIVEALDAAGGRLATGPGLALDDTTVATSFALLNNAARLRVRARDGAALETDVVLAWHRRQDWALLGAMPAGARPAPHASDAVQPGELCYSAGVSGEAALTVASCEIVGVSATEAGTQLNTSFFTAGGNPGAPLLNEYGEVVGMMAEGLAEQAASRAMLRLGQISDVPGTAAVPIAAIASADRSTPTRLSVLAERGLFVPPVTLGRHILSGGFATSIAARGAATQPVDQRVEFARTDKTMTVFVTWNAVERIKGATTLRLYDLDNRSLGEAKPLKLSLRVGQLVMSNWPIAVPAPGIYRADVMLDGHIAWRGHFRVKP